MRTGFTNAPGVTYDATKTDTLFAEDVNELTDSSTNLRPKDANFASFGVATLATQTLASIAIPAIASGETLQLEAYIDSATGGTTGALVLGFSGNVFVSNIATGVSGTYIKVKVLPVNLSGQQALFVEIFPLSGGSPSSFVTTTTVNLSTSQTFDIGVTNNDAVNPHTWNYYFCNGRLWNVGL